MGFFGTFVLARSDRLLANEEATLGFGYQHERLYELGRGWQLLETRGIADRQDLAAASERFVAATGGGVLAAYVNDGNCIGVHGRTPEGWTTSFHLPVDQAPCTYRHRPRPAARTREAVGADLEQWARNAGLTPVPEQVRAIAAYDYRGNSGWGHELPLELLPALGLPGAAEPSPTLIDLEQPPWCAIVGSSGLARQAWGRRSYRDSRDAADSESSARNRNGNARLSRSRPTSGPPGIARAPTPRHCENAPAGYSRLAETTRAPWCTAGAAELTADIDAAPVKRPAANGAGPRARRGSFMSAVTNWAQRDEFVADGGVGAPAAAVSSVRTTACRSPASSVRMLHRDRSSRCAVIGAPTGQRSRALRMGMLSAGVLSWRGGRPGAVVSARR
ncbi:hypothetical protein [Dactylosporangium sp. CA-092794]|uniref:hypothetical protein n=1 Tax=Dactylosporangium sp. CA-092794 TaxID=3239929 RepID=UPI003D8FFBD8